MIDGAAFQRALPVLSANANAPRKSNPRGAFVTSHAFMNPRLTGLAGLFALLMFEVPPGARRVCSAVRQHGARWRPIKSLRACNDS